MTGGSPELPVLFCFDGSEGSRRALRAASELIVRPVDAVVLTGGVFEGAHHRVLLKNMEQIWFITGSSRGLGRALVRAALDAGHRVAATARSFGPSRRASPGRRPKMAGSQPLRRFQRTVPPAVPRRRANVEYGRSSPAPVPMWPPDRVSPAGTSGPTER